MFAAAERAPQQTQECRRSFTRCITTASLALRMPRQLPHTRHAQTFAAICRRAEPRMSAGDAVACFHACRDATTRLLPPLRRRHVRGVVLLYAAARAVAVKEDAATSRERRNSAAQRASDAERQPAPDRSAPWLPRATQPPPPNVTRRYERCLSRPDEPSRIRSVHAPRGARLVVPPPPRACQTANEAAAARLSVHS